MCAKGMWGKCQSAGGGWGREGVWHVKSSPLLHGKEEMQKGRQGQRRTGREVHSLHVYSQPASQPKTHASPWSPTRRQVKESGEKGKRWKEGREGWGPPRTAKSCPCGKVGKRGNGEGKVVGKRKKDRDEHR